MNELLAVAGVMGLFMVRVGVPVLVLVTLGLLVDRWQTRREVEISRMQKSPAQITPLTVAQNDQTETKAA